MSKIKKYFDDYSVAQKACNEFNKKHWLGNIIFTIVMYIVTFGIFAAYLKIKEKIDEKRLNKKLEKYYKEGEES